MTKISISKLLEIYNPFDMVIWRKLDAPLKKEEISEAIFNNDFSDLQPEEFAVTRQHHILRIAWLVLN